MSKSWWWWRDEQMEDKKGVENIPQALKKIDQNLLCCSIPKSKARKRERSKTDWDNKHKQCEILMSASSLHTVMGQYAMISSTTNILLKNVPYYIAVHLLWSWYLLNNLSLLYSACTTVLRWSSSEQYSKSLIKALLWHTCLSNVYQNVVIIQ